MPNWTFYPVFIGTIISVIGLSRIALMESGNNAPNTLSELAAAEDALLGRFRNILIICGVLFAITLFGFIAPQVGHVAFVLFFGILMIGGELLASVIPARGNTAGTHLFLSKIMAIGMLGLGILFSVSLPGVFLVLAVTLTIAMIAFGLLTLLDKKHYLVYELAFIFASHFSVVVAALALK